MRILSVLLLAILLNALLVGLALTTDDPVVAGVPLNHITQPGESLWSIARQYYPNHHTGEIVFEIRELNQIGTTIMPGQSIRLPRGGV